MLVWVLPGARMPWREGPLDLDAFLVAISHHIPAHHGVQQISPQNLKKAGKLVYYTLITLLT